jgi:tetratricopeptide (TPR) repeat protein
MANISDSSSNSGSTASAYDVFTALASQPTQQMALANSALSSGLGFYQKKDYTRAAKEMQRAIALDPTNTQALNYLGNTFLAQKKNREAVKLYKTSLAMDPTQDKLHMSLGNIYLGEKKYSDAEKEFKASMKLNPADTVAPYTLGQMYQQQGRYAEAEKQFKQVIRMAPGDANPLYALGALYNKQGKYADAVKELTQAVKLKPKMAAAHLELGSAYGALDDTNNAQREVDILTRLDAAQGALLQATIVKPKMVAAGGGLVDTFPTALGMNTPVWTLNVIPGSPTDTAKEFSLTFSFDSKMDADSVQNTSNWSITKASGGAAGYYNNLLPVLPTEAYIPQNPTRVSYDPTQQQATVTFLLSQSMNGVPTTIDPSHMVFKFTGKNSNGKTMDPTADQFDGAAQLPF